MTKTTTVISTDDNSIIKDECPSVIVYGIQWPETYVSSLVKRPCPNTSGMRNIATCKLTSISMKKKKNTNILLNGKTL